VSSDYADSPSTNWTRSSGGLGGFGRGFRGRLAGAAGGLACATGRRSPTDSTLSPYDRKASLSQRRILIEPGTESGSVRTMMAHTSAPFPEPAMGCWGSGDGGWSVTSFRLD